MIVGVVKETFPEEHRTALVPAIVSSLTKAGLEAIMESGAGQAAGFPDAEYEEKGVRLVSDRAEVFRTADIVLQVRSFGSNPAAGRADLDLLRPGQVLIGQCDPLVNRQRK